MSVMSNFALNFIAFVSRNKFKYMAAQIRLEKMEENTIEYIYENILF